MHPLRLMLCLVHQLRLFLLMSQPESYNQSDTSWGYCIKSERRCNTAFVNTGRLWKCIKEQLHTCLGVLPKSGSDTLLLDIVILLPSAAHSLIGSIEAEGIKDDIAIVDWLLDTLGATCWWKYSLTWTLPCDVEGAGGGNPPTTRCAVLSKKFSNFPTNFAGAKFVAYPPCKSKFTKRVQF